MKYGSSCWLMVRGGFSMGLVLNGFWISVYRGVYSKKMHITATRNLWRRTKTPMPKDQRLT